MNAEATQSKHRGRKSKGPRRLINFRLPVEQAELAREIATAEGYEHLSDWLAMAVTEHIEKTDLGKARLLNRAQAPG